LTIAKARTRRPRTTLELQGHAEKRGVAHVKDTYATAKVATEEAAELLQNTYAALAEGANDYNLKLFEIVRVNSRVAFDYAQELLGVKSPSGFIEALNGADALSRGNSAWIPSLIKA
jgi:hypothetical protein